MRWRSPGFTSGRASDAAAASAMTVPRGRPASGAFASSVPMVLACALGEDVGDGAIGASDLAVLDGHPDARMAERAGGLAVAGHLAGMHLDPLVGRHAFHG